MITLAEPLRVLRLLRTRQHYFIHRDLQLEVARQTLLVALLAVVLMFANVYVFRALSFLHEDGVFRGTGQLATIAAYVVVLAAMSFGIVFSLALVFAHRIAGPVLKITSTLHRMAAGDHPPRVRLRTSDLLQDVARAVDLATHHHRAAALERRRLVQEALAAECPDQLRAALSKLQGMDEFDRETDQTPEQIL